MITETNTGLFNKLEFWGLTVLFLSLPLYIRGDFHMAIQVITVFLSVLYIDFRVVPALIKCEKILVNVIGLVATFGLIGLIYFLTDNLSLQWVIIAVIIAGHLCIKYLAVYIVSRTESIRSFFIIPNRDGLIVFGIWMIIAYWLLIIPVPTEIRYAWIPIVPTGIVLHAFAFHYFIPGSLRGKYPLISYFFKVALFCSIICAIVAIIIMIITDNEEHASTIAAIDLLFNCFITAPVLWLVYRWKMKGQEKIDALENELDRSTANLDFLRSQINPHFLFNALNTIYGLAIQEKAERTSASVEKLGDMMRFMLFENMQERISLKRELEYLDNYISLQKLRTDGNENLSISVTIPEGIDPMIRITPMLLIPFIENAFKHGISLRGQSYIKIFLELKDTTLYFDIANSIHAKVENDPEKDSNGIGLENVRQRLRHVYPNRHELLIRDTSRDFFVHLKIELD